MKLVSPLDTSHTIVIIPRYYTYENIVLLLNNEVITCTNSLSDGLLSINFDYIFVEGQKFQIKITDNGEVLYRGLLMATAQDTQTFKASKNLYYYE